MMEVSETQSPERLSDMIDTSKLEPCWYRVKHEAYSLGAGYGEYGGAYSYTATAPAEWTGSEWYRWGTVWRPRKVLSATALEGKGGGDGG